MTESFIAAANIEAATPLSSADAARLGEFRRYEALERCERLIRGAIADHDVGLPVEPIFESDWGKVLQAARLALGMEPYIPGRYLEEEADEPITRSEGAVGPPLKTSPQAGSARPLAG